MNNTVILIDTALTALTTVSRIQQLLMQAQMEGRDVTDEEVKALADENSVTAKSLIERLRGENPA